MRKLYNRTGDGTLLHHESWQHDDRVTEHFGRAGERGETRTHIIDSMLDENGNVDKVLKQAVAHGFQEWSDEQYHYLVIEYAIEKKWGNESDLERRHELEDRLNETLGWTGLGHCDGGSIGTGTMEACCIVVDFGLAQKVIEEDLRATKFADFSHIYDESDS